VKDFFLNGQTPTHAGGQWSPVGVENLWATAIFRTVLAIRTCRFERDNHKMLALFVRIQKIIYGVYIIIMLIMI